MNIGHARRATSLQTLWEFFSTLYSYILYIHTFLRFDINLSTQYCPSGSGRVGTLHVCRFLVESGRTTVETPSEVLVEAGCIYMI